MFLPDARRLNRDRRLIKHDWVHFFTFTATLALLLGTPCNLSAGIVPREVGAFLHNIFRLTVTSDSFVIAAMDGGVGTVRLADSSGVRSFHLERFIDDPRPVTGLRLYGDELVVQRDSVYTLYSIRSLPELIAEGEFTLSREVKDYLYADGRFYSANEFEGISRYRLTAGTTLVFEDSSMFGVSVVQLAMRDTTLFALDDYNGILRYDHPESELSSPRPYMPLPFRISSFGDEGDHMLLAAGGVGFKVASYDESGFTTPFAHFSGISDVRRVMESDSTYVIISSGASLLLQSKTDPGDLRILPQSSSDDSYGASLLSVNGKRLLVAPNAEEGLRGFELDVHDFPRLAVRFSHAGATRGVETIGNFMYTGGPSRPIEKYSLTSGDLPTLVGSRDFPPNVHAMTSNGDTLFIVDNGESQLIWAVKTSPDSLPRALGVVTHPADVDRIDAYFDPLAGRRYLILRIGSRWVVSRAEGSTLFGANYADVNLAVGIRSVAMVERYIYAYSAKDELLVASTNYFLDLQLRATIPMYGAVNAIIPWEEKRRLLLFSEGLLWVMDNNDRASPTIIRSIPIQGIYTAADRHGDLLFLVGPQSTGIVSLAEDIPVELFHAARGGTMITAGAEKFLTSDGSSIRVWEYLTTDAPGDDGVILPVEIGLREAYPNPFNSRITLSFNLPAHGAKEAAIEILNILGQRVRLLVLADPGLRTAGEIGWNGDTDAGVTVSSGIYFARLVGVPSSTILKLALIK